MATKKDELSTSQQIKPATIAASETSLEARWGDIILDAGHTSIPNLLLELYSELGISNDQMMLIIHIFIAAGILVNSNPLPIKQKKRKRLE